MKSREIRMANIERVLNINYRKEFNLNKVHLTTATKENQQKIIITHTIKKKLN